MYAILHLPTGKFLVRANRIDCQDLTTYDIDYIGKTLFYNKKDAENYKRKFLIFYYLIIKHHAEAIGSAIVFPKRIPKFLRKKNRFKSFGFSYASYDLGDRSLDFWLSSIKDNTIIVTDPKEFLVIKV
jgi:hypothetical protein